MESLHEGLTVLAARNGVPTAIVMGNTHVQAMWRFWKKTRELVCQIKQVEPYSPWQNVAESSIRELKPWAARKWQHQTISKSCGTNVVYRNTIFLTPMNFKTKSLKPIYQEELQTYPLLSD